MKILLFDLELFPNTIRSWGVYEQNALEVVQDWIIVSIAYKWHHLSEVKVKALPDFDLYKKDKTNDLELVKFIWSLIDEAHVVVAHNGDRFDVKKLRTRFVIHGLPPPSPIQTIDTKKMAKKEFGFDSNKLDELGRQLGVGRKEKTGGYELWQGCMRGDMEAWKKMKRYNKQDVVLLDNVWKKLSAWTDSPANRNVYEEEYVMRNCPRPNCGGVMEKRGFKFYKSGKKQAWCCVRCRGWSQSPFYEGSIIR